MVDSHPDHHDRSQHTGPSVAAAFLPGEPFNTSPTSYSSLSTADRTGVYQHASYDQSVLHHYTPANARQLYPSVRMSSFSSSTGSPISPAQSASPFIPDRPLHPSVAPMIQPPSVGFVNHQQLRSSISGWWAADDLRGRQAWFASSVRRPPPLVSPTHATSSSFYAVAHTRPFRTQAAVAPPISSPAISQASSALASRQSATRRRKMVVRLPLSGKADHRVPLSPTTQATVAAKMSEDGAHLVEPASRRPHFEEGTRDGLPDTLDVYLPGQIAWQDLREEFAVRLRTEVRPRSCSRSLPYVSSSLTSLSTPLLQPSLSMEYGQKPDAGRPKQLHSRSRSLFTPPQLLPPRFRTAGAHDESWRGHRLAKSLTTTTDFVNEAVSGNRADLLTWPPLSIGQPRLESVFAPDNLAGRISSPVPPAYLESDKSQDGDAESTDYAGRCHTASPRFPGSAAFESDGDNPEQGVVVFDVFDGGARSASLNPGALTFQPVASVPMMRTNSPLLAKGTRRPLPPLPIPQTKLPAESSHRSIGFASPVPVLVELKHPQPRRPLPPSPLEASESDADAAPANSLRTGLQAPLDDAERSSTSFEDPLPEQYAPARMYSQQRSIPKDRFAALEPSRPRDAVDGVGQLRPSASSPARMGDPRALQHELARQRAPSGETELASEAGLSEVRSSATA